MCYFVSSRADSNFFWLYIIWNACFCWLTFSALLYRNYSMLYFLDLEGYLLEDSLNCLNTKFALSSVARHKWYLQEYQLKIHICTVQVKVKIQRNPLLMTVQNATLFNDGRFLIFELISLSICTLDLNSFLFLMAGPWGYIMSFPTLDL